MLRSIFIYLILGLVLIPRSKIVLAITSQNCISNIHTNHIRDSQLKFFFKVSNDTQQQECKSFRIFLKHVSNHLRQVWGTAIFSWPSFYAILAVFTKTVFIWCFCSSIGDATILTKLENISSSSRNIVHRHLTVYYFFAFQII